MFSNPFQDHVVFGTKDKMSPTAEEVGVDIVDALDAFGINEKTDIPAKPKTPILRQTQDQLFLMSKLTKSMSQSSSGVFSDSKSAKTYKIRTSALNRAERLLKRRGIHWCVMPTAKKFSSSNLYKNILVDFRKDLRRICVEQSNPTIKISYDLKKDANLISVIYTLNVRLALPSGGKNYLDSVIKLTNTRFVALHEGLKQCDVHLEDVEAVAVDDFLQICFVRLGNLRVITMTHFESLDVFRDFMTVVEFRKRRLSSEKGVSFQPFVVRVSLERLTAGRPVSWHCGLLGAEVTRQEELGEECKVLEGQLMFQELDDVLDDKIDSWTTGGFLVK